MPANRLPSVCCAARPTTTAVSAPPSASVCGVRPATRRARHRRRDDGRQPEQEADGPGRGGLQAAEEERAERAADVARELPAHRHERDGGEQPHRAVPLGAEEPSRSVVDLENSDERRQQHERLDPRAADRAPAEVTGERRPRARRGYGRRQLTAPARVSRGSTPCPEQPRHLTWRWSPAWPRSGPPGRAVRAPPGARRSARRRSGRAPSGDRRRAGAAARARPRRPRRASAAMASTSRSCGLVGDRREAAARPGAAGHAGEKKTVPTPGRKRRIPPRPRTPGVDPRVARGGDPAPHLGLVVGTSCAWRRFGAASWPRLRRAPRRRGRAGRGCAASSSSRAAPAASRRARAACARSRAVRACAQRSSAASPPRSPAPAGPPVRPRARPRARRRARRARAHAPRCGRRGRALRGGRRRWMPSGRRRAARRLRALVQRQRTELGDLGADLEHDQAARGRAPTPAAVSCRAARWRAAAARRPAALSRSASAS